jgi:hypothetical protein
VLRDTTPKLVFDVADAALIGEFAAAKIEGVPFHDGTGPYETTIALTPIDANGKPVESETSAMSYDFTGVQT